MNDTAITYVLVGCPFDQWRTWFRPDDEPAPSHDCTQGVPQGMTVATFSQSTRVDPPWPKGRSKTS